jgi:hypothetical protein
MRMNVFCRPMPSSQAVNAKRTVAANPLRMKTTAMRASARICGCFFGEY